MTSSAVAGLPLGHHPRVRPPPLHIVSFWQGGPSELVSLWQANMAAMAAADADNSYTTHLMTKPLPVNASSSTGYASFGTPAWQSAIRDRIAMLRSYALHHRGALILFTDLDVVPLRPYSLLKEYVLPGAIHFMPTAHHYSLKREYALPRAIRFMQRSRPHGCNAGFYIFRSDEATLRQLDRWCEGIAHSRGDEKFGDQSVLNNLSLCQARLPDGVVASCCGLTHNLTTLDLCIRAATQRRNADGGPAVAFHAICTRADKLESVRWASSYAPWGRPEASGRLSGIIIILLAVSAITIFFVMVMSPRARHRLGVCVHCHGAGAAAGKRDRVLPTSAEV